jgi:hypothetical protein
MRLRGGVRLQGAFGVVAERVRETASVGFRVSVLRKSAKSAPPPRDEVTAAGRWPDAGIRSHRRTSNGDPDPGRCLTSPLCLASLASLETLEPRKRAADIALTAAAGHGAARESKTPAPMHSPCRSPVSIRITSIIAAEI